MDKNKCKKCGSLRIKKKIKDINSDNVMHVYVCQDCGYQEFEIFNIPYST